MAAILRKERNIARAFDDMAGLGEQPGIICVDSNLGENSAVITEAYEARLAQGGAELPVELLRTLNVPRRPEQLREHIFRLGRFLPHIH